MKTYFRPALLLLVIDIPIFIMIMNWSAIDTGVEMMVVCVVVLLGTIGGLYGWSSYLRKTQG